jgi:hypothetical protein
MFFVRVERVDDETHGKRDLPRIIKICNVMSSPESKGGVNNYTEIIHVTFDS